MDANSLGRFLGSQEGFGGIGISRVLKGFSHGNTKPQQSRLIFQGM